MVCLGRGASSTGAGGAASSPSGGFGSSKSDDISLSTGPRAVGPPTPWAAAAVVLTRRRPRYQSPGGAATVALDHDAVIAREITQPVAQAGRSRAFLGSQELLEAGEIETADHRLDRAEGGGRHGEIAVAEPDQRHGAERVAAHLAAQRQLLVRYCAGRGYRRQHAQHRRRKRVIAFGHAGIAA